MTAQRTEAGVLHAQRLRDRFLRAAERSGMTDAAVLRELGLSKNTLRRYRQGETLPFTTGDRADRIRDFIHRHLTMASPTWVKDVEPERSVSIAETEEAAVLDGGRILIRYNSRKGLTITVGPEGTGS